MLSRNITPVRPDGATPRQRCHARGPGNSLGASLFQSLASNPRSESKSRPLPQKLAFYPWQESILKIKTCKSLGSFSEGYIILPCGNVYLQVWRCRQDSLSIPLSPQSPGSQQPPFLEADPDTNRQICIDKVHVKPHRLNHLVKKTPKSFHQQEVMKLQMEMVHVF